LSARTLVEGEVAALAAVNATSDDLDALRQTIQRMTTHVDDFVIREETDREFHLGIAKATGNGSLELVVEGLWNQRAELWGRMQQHYHTEALARRTIHDHAAILAAITARNPEAARTAMHRHLARVVREFQRGGNSKVKGTVVESAPKRTAAAKGKNARAHA
jgi:DNA-binding FadR family transcriptional regulator